MARIQFWQYLLDRQGNPLEYVNVDVYLAGTNTEANIYLDANFGSMTTSSAIRLTTNKYGLVKFWIGDEYEVEGGYGVDQQFKIKWYNDVDGITETIDNFYIFTPVRKIDITSSDIIKDKVISNNQGYDWDTHVDSYVYDTLHPHDITSVTFFNLDSSFNKVISNKLGYQMFQTALDSLTISGDVSASNYISSEVSSLSSSGGLYYKDITHNFNNYFPVVNILNQNNIKIIPENIESIGINTIRVWVNENITMKVIIMG